MDFDTITENTPQSASEEDLTLLMPTNSKDLSTIMIEFTKQMFEMNKTNTHLKTTITELKTTITQLITTVDKLEKNPAQNGSNKEINIKEVVNS